MDPNTKDDALKWYNVGDWAKLGLAVPNWSDDGVSQNQNIRYLTNIMGRNTQAILFHDDARLTTPPSINTLTRVHKLCVRARSILFARAVPSNVKNMESKHANPAPEVHVVYPTPYFMVRNQWLKDWAAYILTAITEAMQHQENAKANDISVDFGALIGQYIHRVYKYMAIELFQVPKVDAEKDGFTLTTEMLNSYNPGAYFTSTEMIDTVPTIGDEPTDDTLKEITRGIPVTHLPNLGPWPARVAEGGPKPDATANSGDEFLTADNANA